MAVHVMHVNGIIRAVCGNLLGFFDKDAGTLEVSGDIYRCETEEQAMDKIAELFPVEAVETEEQKRQRLTDRINANAKGGVYYKINRI